VEWPLPLGEGDEKRGVSDPKKKKQPENYNVNTKKRKTRQAKKAKITAGRG
jgi:hypothetical protein